MSSLYVDDALHLDLGQAGQASQAFIGQVFILLGTPFAEAKRKEMSQITKFLDMLRDFTFLVTSGDIRFWVREELHSKCESLIRDHVETNSFTPAQAAKLIGNLGFFCLPRTIGLGNLPWGHCCREGIAIRRAMPSLAHYFSPSFSC